ncbi:MAG TPA: translation initiation factor IF-2 [Candidatus Norongarragalinales archaeon]|jgi:translation initiation factor 5B|nr:translation initiation factor IF-2 [Candidatus Norongarragalinales archaeon]
MLRQPIITILGHVDHGKTTLADAIRNTKVQEREAGGITQHIGASEIPTEVVRAIAKDLIEKSKLELTVPGLLMIDTPGHEAFANLRKRGGSIADLAILVIDINQGIQNQTIEAIEILKSYKTPFIVAATKIDAITGWRANEGDSFTDSFNKQRPDVQARLDELLYKLVGQLFEYGFNTERFDRVTDFTKQILIIPVSGRTREGLQELLMYAAGLSQRFLGKRLELHEDTPARGNILEVREEKGLGKTLDVILYDGVLHSGDTIVFATIDGPVASKVKALLKPKPLDEMRDPREKFKPVESVGAAAGVKISCPDAEKALAGSEVLVARNEEEIERAKTEAAKQIHEVVFESEKTGVIIKADALGTLEAITKLFQIEKIPVKRAGIGRVSRKEIVEAENVHQKDPFAGVLFAFNVPIEDDARAEAEKNGIKIFEEKVIYNLIQGYQAWKEEAKQREKKEAFARLTLPAKVRVLDGMVFRASGPFIAGVEVLEGVIRRGYELMSEEGKLVGTISAIQVEKKGVEEARKGQQVAMSMPEPVLGRQVFEKQVLITNVPKEDAKTLESKYAKSLSTEELALLKEIKKIKGYTLFG